MATQLPAEQYHSGSTPDLGFGTMRMNAEIKAQLLSLGSADIDRALLLHEAARTTVPAAGPGAGMESFFSKNRVSSNFIIGLGESDECVLSGVAQLAEIGVIPNLRPISPHPLRADEVKVQRPSAERLLKLARATRKVLDEHGLRADLAETMCLPCTGCDITPHRDV
jgi:hypothetical protein